MEMSKEMPLGVKQLLTTVTHLKEGEKVLVITDDGTSDRAESRGFHSYAR